MVARFTLCDASKLQLALAGELPEAALGELSRHLQSCPHCREELDTLAGGQRWASDARQYLSSSEELVAVQEMTPPAGLPPVPAPGFSANHFRPSSPHDGEEPVIDLDFLSASEDPTKLGRLGCYEIESVIGRGGFGIVLKAFDPALNRYVAIKALSGTLVRSSAARKRFNKEAKAAAGVVHDHVIPIHHIDTSGSAPYLVMPFVTGRSLQERIDDRGPLETREVLRIAMQTAQGLAAAHALGLVHRDVKPANILLENGVERVRITDFGLARAVDDASQTQSGYIAGTPQYMAPEQARGESIDARADLFSLGSVMYAMCTGHPPFRAETTLAVLRRICDDEPRPLLEINPEVPAWLAEIVNKLLAKNAAERFQSADEIAELLGKWLAHVQQPTAIPPPITLTKENRRRALALRFLGGSVAALAAGMLLAAVAIWLPGMLIKKAPVHRESQNTASNRQKPLSLKSESISPVELAAAARSDRDEAAAIDTELMQSRQHLEQLEAALRPPEHADDGPIAAAEINGAIERLELEMRIADPAARSSKSEILPSPD